MTMTISEKLSEETIAERFARLGHGKNYATALAFLRIPARYIDMGQACERHGLARFADDGEMLFQAPDDVIAENAVAAYNAARAEARPAVDREAVARELWNLATGCEPGEAWAWEKAIWIAAFWPEAFSCRDLVSKCFQATDAILALLSPATPPGAVDTSA